MKSTTKIQNNNEKTQRMKFGNKKSLQEPVAPMQMTVEKLYYIASSPKITETEKKDAINQLEKRASVIGEDTEMAIKKLTQIVLVKNSMNIPAFRVLCCLTGSLDPAIKEHAKKAIEVLAKKEGGAEDTDIRNDARIELGLE